MKTGITSELSAGVVKCYLQCQKSDGVSIMSPSFVGTQVQDAEMKKIICHGGLHHGIDDGEDLCVFLRLFWSFITQGSVRGDSQKRET